MKITKVSNDGNKTALISLRTFGGYRVVLLNNYFDKQEECFFNDYSEALNYVDKWLTLD